MYIRLAKSKYNKEEFVYLVESYRDEKKKPKQRVIKSFGTLSELTKNNPNALEELKGWAKDLSDQQKEERYVSLLLDMNESMTDDQIPLNYGYVFLEAIV